MTRPTLPQAQRGAILVVGLIMLVLITLTVTIAFNFSTSNLKAVGNMQSRNEAIAAANKGVEQVVGSWDFSSAPTADEFNVDIDNNGTTDYVVRVATPVCVKATAVTIQGSNDSECPPGADGLFPPNCAGTTSVYNVVWDIDATATGHGTQVRVRQGVSKSISKDQCNIACPPAPGTPCA
jgi:Tfp pilus assembly protein PilX